MKGTTGRTERKQKFFRFAAGLLAVLMMIPVMASCKKKKGGDEEDNTVTTESGDTTQRNVLDGVDFGGKELGVLYWKSGNLQEYVPKYDSADEINQEVYNRNEAAKSRIGVNVVWTECTGAGYGKPYIEMASNDAQTGGVFDIFCGQSRDAGSLAIQGLYSNLKQYEYIDLESPWWATRLAKDCTIYDKLFFCTGDISTNLVFMTSAIFFNKDMVENYHINDAIKEKYGAEDLYDLVEQGNWTYEAMMTLSQDIYFDNDVNEKKSEADTLGFGTYGTLVDNFWYGAGYMMVDVNEDGLKRSNDYTGKVDEVTSILFMCKNFFTKDGALLFDRVVTKEVYKSVRDSFRDGRIMFSMAPASHALVGAYNAKEGLRYGILPIPKYTTEQDGYSSVNSHHYSLYGVSTASNKRDAATAFLQALGEASYTTTRTMIYEKTMSGKLSDTSSDEKMWDYVIKSQTFDLGRIFADSIVGTNDSGKPVKITLDVFSTKVKKGSDTWNSSVDAWKNQLATCCNTINESIRKNEN